MNNKKQLAEAIKEGAKLMTPEIIKSMEKGTQKNFVPPAELMSKYAIALSLLNPDEMPEVVRSDELTQDKEAMWKYRRGSDYVAKHSDTPEQGFVSLMSYLKTRFDFRANLLVDYFSKQAERFKKFEKDARVSFNIKDFELFCQDYLPRISCNPTAENMDQAFGLDGEPPQREVWERMVQAAAVNLPLAYHTMLSGKNKPDIIDRYWKPIEWGFQGSALMVLNILETFKAYFKKSAKQDEAILAILALRSTNYLNRIFQKKEKFLAYETLMILRKSPIFN